MAIDKLVAFYRQAIEMSICRIITNDNKLVRINLKEVNNNIDDYRCKCGYFSEYDAADLKEIVQIIKYKYQTVAVYGLKDDDIRKFVIENHLIGIDRFVQFGDTTSFSLTWDGYNLIHTLSREITIF